MKKLLILLSIILFSSSCITKQICDKRFPPELKDSIYVHDTTYVWDTIVKFDERTIEIHDTVPCDDFMINKDSNGLHIVIKVKDGKLTAICKADSLEKVIHFMKTVRSISRYKELIRTKESFKPISWWNRTMIIGGYIFFGLVLIAVGFGIYKLIRLVS